MQVAAALTYESSRWLTLAQGGDFGSVVAHLRSGSADADAARQCVRALLIATANAPAKQAQACAACAADAAVAALKAHSADAVVVRDVCLLLWTLGEKHEGFCTRVVALGALEAVVRAMRVHPTNAHVQDEALTALYFVTVNRVDIIERARAVAAVIPAVTAAMRACAGNAQAQAHGCAMPSSLIESGADQDDGAEAGAIQAALAALHAHPLPSARHPARCTAYSPRNARMAASAASMTPAASALLAFPAAFSCAMLLRALHARACTFALAA
jgi:hypothetical protein